MPGEELCKICRRPHPTGFCVESEKSIDSKVDPLFKRLHHLEENPEIPKGATKKEISTVAIPEKVIAENLDFLFNLKSCGVEIPQDDILQLFLDMPDVDSLRHPDSVIEFIIEYIKLQMVQKQDAKVDELCNHFLDMFPKKAGVLNGLYKFALEIGYPSHSIRLLVISRGSGLDMANKVEQKYNDNDSSDQDKQKYYAAEFGTYITGLRNHDGDKLADETVEFARRYYPGEFEIVPRIKKPNKESLEAQELSGRIEELSKLASRSLNKFGSFGSKEKVNFKGQKKIYEIREELSVIIAKDTNPSWVVKKAQNVLSRIESSVVNILISNLKMLSHDIYDERVAKTIVNADRLAISGDTRGAIGLLDQAIAEKMFLGEKTTDADEVVSVDSGRNAPFKKAKVKDQLVMSVEYTDSEKSEIERAVSENLDKLFSRFRELKSSNDVKSGEDVQGAKSAYEMDFLIDIAAAGSDIKLQNIERMFAETNGLESLNTAESIRYYIKSCMKLKIMKGDVKGAVSLCQRFTAEDLGTGRIYESLYNFCLANGLPMTEEFKRIVLSDTAVDEKRFVRAQDHTDVISEHKDQQGHIIYNLNLKIKVLRDKGLNELADRMQKYASAHVDNFNNFSLRRLKFVELKRTIRTQLNYSSREDFDLRRSLKHINSVRRIILNLLPTTVGNLAILEGEEALYQTDEIKLTLLLERLGEISSKLQKRETQHVRMTIAEAVQMFDSGDRETAVDLVIDNLKLVEKLLEDRKMAKEQAQRFEEAKNEKVEKLLEDFYSFLAKRDEVAARKKLEELRELVPNRFFASLEHKFYSMPIGNDRPKRNAVWLNMADRTPVNKLAYNVSDRRLKKFDNGDDD